MGFETDESAWPIVRLRWIGTLTDPDVAAELARIDGYLARGERFGLLIDARGGGGLSPQQRHRVVAHLKKQAHLTARFLVQAAVMDNMIQRTLYYGVNLLVPSPFPTKVFAEPVAAEEWLGRMLAKPTTA